jgi:hypothetical protein
MRFNFFLLFLGSFVFGSVIVINDGTEMPAIHRTKELTVNEKESQFDRSTQRLSRKDQGSDQTINDLKRICILGAKGEIDKSTLIHSIYRQLDQLPINLPDKERRRLCEVALGFFEIILKNFDHIEFIRPLGEDDARSQKSIVISIVDTLLTRHSAEFLNLLDELRPMGVIFFFFVMLAEKYKWITFKESLSYFNSRDAKIPLPLLKHSMIVIEELKSKKIIPNNDFVNFLLKWLDLERIFNSPNQKKMESSDKYLYMI